jgi:hypothetical protein
VDGPGFVSFPPAVAWAVQAVSCRVWSLKTSCVSPTNKIFTDGMVAMKIKANSRRITYFWKHTTSNPDKKKDQNVQISLKF